MLHKFHVCCVDITNCSIAPCHVVVERAWSGSYVGDALIKEFFRVLLPMRYRQAGPETIDVGALNMNKSEAAESINVTCTTPTELSIQHILHRDIVV